MKMERIVIFVAAFAMVASTQSFAQEKTGGKAQETTALKLANGKFVMQAPKSWKGMEPKSSMIEAEFSVPMADGDSAEKDGRLTIMAAGGGVDANVTRWQGQFSQPDGKSTKDKTTVKEIEVDGMKAHMVDIKGTYAERTRMTDPPTMQDDYRMLAAIIETGGREYFIKFYGGAKTVEANKKWFDQFIKSFEKAN
ncbi:MAG: hypothetical protein P8J33_10025 [Pirellulaceae bacterium]|nr:hypothetical protein [Pirellulaceae bacterium]